MYWVAELIAASSSGCSVAKARVRPSPRGHRIPSNPRKAYGEPWGLLGPFPPPQRVALDAGLVEDV